MVLKLEYYQNILDYIGDDGVGFVGCFRADWSPEHPVEVHGPGVLDGDLPEYHGAVSVNWLHLESEHFTSVWRFCSSQKNSQQFWKIETERFLQ